MYRIFLERILLIKTENRKLYIGGEAPVILLFSVLILLLRNILKDIVWCDRVVIILRKMHYIPVIPIHYLTVFLYRL